MQSIYKEGELMKKKELLKEYDDMARKLNMANGTVANLMEHIDMLNKQLAQQDKAIERKDKQFLGLRTAYQDEIINRGD